MCVIRSRSIMLRRGQEQQEAGDSTAKETAARTAVYTNYFLYVLATRLATPV